MAFKTSEGPFAQMNERMKLNTTYQLSFLKKRTYRDIVNPQIPLYPPFSKGEVFLLPLAFLSCHRQAKGGGEGFYKRFFKGLKCYRIIILSLLLIFLLPNFSFSQARPWRKDARCWGASELNLSSEQAKSLDLLQQAYLKETQLLRAQLITKRLEFREFLTNPTIRMESIRAKYLEVAETQSKMEEKAIEYLVKVRSLLTHEQLKSWCPEQEFPLFQRMMPGHRPMGPMSPRRPSPPEE
jgi:Spy/CpxP family protein refolding chaperone